MVAKFTYKGEEFRLEDLQKEPKGLLLEIHRSIAEEIKSLKEKIHASSNLEGIDPTWLYRTKRRLGFRRRDLTAVNTALAIANEREKNSNKEKSEELLRLEVERLTLKVCLEKERKARQVLLERKFLDCAREYLPEPHFLKILEMSKKALEESNG